MSGKSALNTVLSTVSGTVSGCVASMMEEEGSQQGMGRSQGASAMSLSPEEEREVRLVFEEGLRLKRKVKDLTRVLHDTEDQRYQDRREYERAIQDREASFEHLQSKHALDLQELRDAQAVDLHDLLKQLLDCKTTLVRKTSDVEELTKILKNIEEEHAKREQYYQKCMSELVGAHEVDKLQLRERERSREMAQGSWRIEQTASSKGEASQATGSEGDSASPKPLSKAAQQILELEASLLRERAERSNIQAALVASRLAQEKAELATSQLQSELAAERGRNLELEAQIEEVIASRAKVESSVQVVQDENERLAAMHCCSSHGQNRSGTVPNESVLTHAFAQHKIPFHAPPPVPGFTGGLQQQHARNLVHSSPVMTADSDDSFQTSSTTSTFSFSPGTHGHQPSLLHSPLKASAPQPRAGSSSGGSGPGSTSWFGGGTGKGDARGATVAKVISFAPTVPLVSGQAAQSSKPPMLGRSRHNQQHSF